MYYLEKGMEKGNIYYNFEKRQNFFEAFKEALSEKYPLDDETFFEVEKSSIAQEIGRAAHPQYKEIVKEIASLASIEALLKITSIEELEEHVRKYHKLILTLEKDAWDFAAELLQDEIAAELFQIVRSQMTLAHETINYLERNNSFFYTYKFLLCSHKVDILKRRESNGQKTLFVRMMINRIPYHGELVVQETEYKWLPETIKQYNPLAKQWESLTPFFDFREFNFAMEQIQYMLEDA